MPMLRCSVFAADLDGDGDVDVLSALNADNKIAWYRNDGNENFTPLTISSAANGAFSVFAADVDGDGDLDVASASYSDGKIAWYENDGSGNFTPHTISTAAIGALSVFAADVDGDGDLDMLSASFADNKIAWYENMSGDILGLHIFYENSAWDDPDGFGGVTGAGASAFDDLAIADKQALLPGETADFDNYTSYDRGINGIMIDAAELGAEPTLLSVADFFAFRVGNDHTYTSPGWTTAPAPIDVSVRHIAGDPGFDRITIIWADNVIQKQWLEVTMLANTSTGLEIPKVHYWGNAIGETGNNTPHDATVNATDQTGARDNFTTFLNPANLTNLYDFNRDKRVNATDQAIARDNFTSFISVLRLITPPEPASRGSDKGGSTPDRLDNPDDVDKTRSPDSPDQRPFQSVTNLPRDWLSVYQFDSPWQIPSNSLQNQIRVPTEAQVNLDIELKRDPVGEYFAQDPLQFEILGHDRQQISDDQTFEVKLDKLDDAFADRDFICWDFINWDFK